MSSIDDLRLEIVRSINTLRRRLVSTTDEAEKKALKQAIRKLNGRLSVLNQAGLLEAAGSVADASTALEAVVGAARIGPFGGYLGALEEHLAKLMQLAREMHASESLPPAPGDGAAAAVARGGPAPAPRARGIDGPRPVTDFAQLESEYAAWWDACRVRPDRAGHVAYYVKRLRQGQASYDAVGAELGIPGAFIGVIHGMECGFDFGCHLHNGDPLTARTVRVPANRPQNGAPPFTWHESATDALTLLGFHRIRIGDWSIPRMLYLLERYNGMGYRKRGLPTPYLWSFSNLYEKGKFVSDGRFDPEAVSKQCGAALVLKAALPAQAPRSAARRARPKARAAGTRKRRATTRKRSATTRRRRKPERFPRSPRIPVHWGPEPPRWPKHKGPRASCSPSPSVSRSPR